MLIQRPRLLRRRPAVPTPHRLPCVGTWRVPRPAPLRAARAAGRQCSRTLQRRRPPPANPRGLRPARRTASRSASPRLVRPPPWARCQARSVTGRRCWSVASGPSPGARPAVPYGGRGPVAADPHSGCGNHPWPSVSSPRALPRGAASIPSRQPGRPPCHTSTVLPVVCGRLDQERRRTPAESRQPPPEASSALPISPLLGHERHPPSRSALRDPPGSSSKRHLVALGLGENRFPSHLPHPGRLITVPSTVRRACASPSPPRAAPAAPLRPRPVPAAPPARRGSPSSRRATTPAPAPTPGPATVFSRHARSGWFLARRPARSFNAAIPPRTRFRGLPTASRTTTPSAVTLRIRQPFRPPSSSATAAAARLRPAPSPTRCRRRAISHAGRRPNRTPPAARFLPTPCPPLHHQHHALRRHASHPQPLIAARPYTIQQHPGPTCNRPARSASIPRAFTLPSAAFDRGLYATPQTPHRRLSHHFTRRSQGLPAGVAPRP